MFPGEKSTKGFAMSSIEDEIDLDFDPAEDDFQVSVPELSPAKTQPSEVIEDVRSDFPNETKEVKKKKNRHTRIRYQSESSENDLDDQTARKRNVDYSSPLKREKKSKFCDDSSEREREESDEILDLYRSMDVDLFSKKYRLHSVYVRGVDNLSVYEIEKIFAEYTPEAIEMVDDASCNVIWDRRLSAAEMMLGMTKPLKRVRGGRLIEEGEVSDSDGEEEDGEMREEHGDYVTISMSKDDSVAPKNSATDGVIEVDVDQVQVPPGKWRVITKHVSHNRLIILRFGLRADIGKGYVRLRKSSEAEKVDEDGYTYKWMNKRNRVRPGLNIFDDKGNELDWDYEHDTRFYEEAVQSPSQEKDTTKYGDSESTQKRKIKTRGRGAKRFKFLDDSSSETDSLAADREQFNIKRRPREVSNEGRWKKYEEDSSSENEPEGNGRRLRFSARYRFR